MHDAINTALSSALGYKRLMADLKVTENTAKNLAETNNLIRAQEHATQVSAAKAQWEQQSIKEDIKNKELTNQVVKSSLPGIKAEADIDRSSFGKVMRWVNRFANSIGLSAGASAKARDAIMSKTK